MPRERTAEHIRHYAIHKESILQRGREHYRSHWPEYAVRQAKRRSKESSVAFEITKEDVIVPEICPVLGLTLAVGSGKRTASSPSLDRILPKLGYIRGNVQVLSERANRMKNDATPEELVLFAKWVQRTYPEMF